MPLILGVEDEERTSKIGAGTVGYAPGWASRITGIHRRAEYLYHERILVSARVVKGGSSTVVVGNPDRLPGKSRDSQGFVSCCSVLLAMPAVLVPGWFVYSRPVAPARNHQST